jgi:hypothetical protein
MLRSRVRVCLQDGLRLDLNRLARKGFIKFGMNIGLRGIAWKIVSNFGGWLSVPTRGVFA